MLIGGKGYRHALHNLEWIRVPVIVQTVHRDMFREHVDGDLLAIKARKRKKASYTGQQDQQRREGSQLCKSETHVDGQIVLNQHILVNEEIAIDQQGVIVIRSPRPTTHGELRLGIA